MRADRRALLLACTAVAGGILVLAALVLADVLWPVARPVVTQRTTLSSATRSAEAGIPVPASAQRCQIQHTAAPGSVRWCLPAGVSATTVSRWYDDVLPPGRDAGPLRWCVEQYLSNGGRRELWSSPAGLVGYDLPPKPPHVQTGDVGGAVAVAVVALPGSACPPAARASREQA